LTHSGPHGLLVLLSTIESLPWEHMDLIVKHRGGATMAKHRMWAEGAQVPCEDGDPCGSARSIRRRPARPNR
jgi:hypothetical protein